MLRFFTRRKAAPPPPPPPEPSSSNEPAKSSAPSKAAAPPTPPKDGQTPKASVNGVGGESSGGGGAATWAEERRQGGTLGGKGKQRASSEDDEAAKEKRQVAFVSPAPTPTPGALLNSAPPNDRRSPSPPLPSLPALRHAASSNVGPTGTIRAGASTFHHPPASLSGPTAAGGGFRSVSGGSAGGSGSQSSQGHGNSSRDSERRPVISPLGGAASPAMSYASSFGGSGRRGSGSIRPADTWGGTVIGGGAGEDIYQPLTWSEMNDVDLVENLSGRERTRQEVLWEIVTSEERYVGELLSLKENYVDPLLHPLRSPPLAGAPFPGSSSGSHSPSPGTRQTSGASSPNPNQTSDFLPIAARFARSGSSRASISSKQSEGHDFIPDIESEDSHTPHRSPTQQPPGAFPSSSAGRRYPSDPPPADTQNTQSQQVSSLFRRAFQFGSSSQSKKASLPPSNNASSTSLVPGPSRDVDRPSGEETSTSKGIRHYLKPPAPPNKLHKPEVSSTTPVVDLPESLRIVLGVIGDSLLRGHQDLSVKLKERYLEQFPLVRDLTSVWADQTWIIQKYTVYVLHLERALAELDSIFAAADPKASHFSRIDRTVASKFMRLEEKASDRGECGLAICLSKPFQRLLKYPLLFQNLLYHTDASTHEYESAQSMAIAIDSLVRSIEDEKVSEEERDRARDAWARIDGVRDKALMLPQSNRLLMSEEPVWQPAPGKGRRTVSDAVSPRPTSPPSSPEVISRPRFKDRPTAERMRALKGQKSFRRLSDMVASDVKEPSLGSKRDVWLVVFSDVVLRCQRIGVTQLSGAALTKAKDKDLKKLQRRHSLPGKDRNLYRFLKVEKWETHPSLVNNEDERTQFPVDGAGEGMEVDASARAGDDDEANEEAMPRDRRESTMSFTYDLDEPKPATPSILTTSTNQPARKPMSPSPPAKSPPTSPRGLSQTTQSVMAKRTPAVNKFQNRLGAPSFGTRSPSPRAGAATPRAPSAAGHYRYEAPTSSTLAKARVAASPRPMSPPPARGAPRRRAASGGQAAPSSSKPSGAVAAAASPPRRRAGSGPSSPTKKSDSAPLVPTVPRQQSQDFSEFTRYFTSPPGSHGST